MTLKTTKGLLTAVAAACLLFALNAPAQTPEPSKASQEKFSYAQYEYSQGNLQKSLKMVKEVALREPTWIDPLLQEASTLFLLHRYSEAGDVYQAARTLDDTQHKLTPDQRHLIVMQRGMVFFYESHPADAIPHFEGAVKEDATYPLYYYNLAVAYALTNDIDHALPNLKKAWELRDHMPEDKSFPDPRQDNAFKKFASDPRFQAVVANIDVS